MIKSRIKVINVEYGKGKTELISAQIKTKYGETPKIVVAYIPPKKKLDSRTQRNNRRYPRKLRKYYQMQSE